MTHQQIRPDHAIVQTDAKLQIAKSSPAAIAATAVRPARPTTFRPRLLRRALNKVLATDQRYRSRRALASLDAHLLRDIGLTPEDVRREIRRTF